MYCNELPSACGCFEVLAVIFDCYGKIRAGITEKDHRFAVFGLGCCNLLTEMAAPLQGYSLDDCSKALRGAAEHGQMVCSSFSIGLPLQGDGSSVLAKNGQE